jgi:uncharacterized protein (TIGR02452 family)
MSNAWLRREAWTQTQQLFADRPSFESELLNTVPSANTLLSLARFPSTSVDFVKADSIDIACAYSYHGASVALVCDAQWDSNYESVQHGAPTQEADCYRRSNYYKHLQIDRFYPLGPLDTFVSRNVEFIRVGLNKQYFFIDKSVTMNIVTAPALDQPSLKSCGKFFASTSEEAMMENKIKIILYAAAKSGVNYVVIPAWGCKEHRCPAYHVGALFHKVIQESNGIFVKIIFAIEGALHEEFKAGFES